MRVELYGLTMDAPGVTFYLWSPWRCSALEHRLFDAVKAVPNATLENAPDEVRLHVNDAKGWKLAVQHLSRVLKGWQEDAEMGSDRRTWRWLLEGDTNADGYDAQGDPASLWGLLRVSLDRGGPADGEKGEDIDLEGFSLRIWGQGEK